MLDIIKMLPILAIAVSINIILGMYYNIGRKKIMFDWKILLQGIFKAVIVAISFIGLAYCFDVVDLSSIGITPTTIMGASIILYVTKDIDKLSKVLGVEKE